MKDFEEIMIYGSLKKGNVYKRHLLEEYVERYRCMLIESGAKRGVVATDYNDNYVVKEVIKNASGNFYVGRMTVSNKFFAEVIIVEKMKNI